MSYFKLLYDFRIGELWLKFRRVLCKSADARLIEIMNLSCARKIFTSFDGTKLIFEGSFS